jgi:hypothetical protein
MRGLVIAALIALSATGPALADCWDDIGCSDSDYYSKSDLRDLDCDVLWEMRNEIYAENGYCFKTKKAIKFFGNDECEYDDAADIEFNKYEKRNISTIAAVEKSEGC